MSDPLSNAAIGDDPKVDPILPPSTAITSLADPHNTLGNNVEPHSIIVPPSLTSLSDSGLSTRLSDLPAEILHLVVGHLWTREDHVNWYDPFDLDRSSYREQMNRSRMRKDALALASCSKDLRRTIFQDGMVDEVTVKMDRQEFSELAALSEDVRCCVRQLIIETGKPTKGEDQQGAVCFHHFINLFPNLRQVSVWSQFDPNEQPLPPCKSCTAHQDPPLSNHGSTCIPSTLQEVRIRAELLDRTNGEQELIRKTHERLRCLLRRLQFSTIQAISVSIDTPCLLIMPHRSVYLSTIVEACNALCKSSITEASLTIEMRTDGSTPQVETFDMSSFIFRKCWIENKFKSMDVHLLFRGEAAYRFEEVEDPWAEELITFGPPIPCPATPLSPSRLIDLATVVKTARPGLENFSLTVGCVVPNAEHYVDKPLGFAEWKLEFPPSTSTELSIDRETETDNKSIDYALTLPFNEDAAVNVTVRHRHQGFECCSAVREHERAIVGDVADDARADPSGYGFDMPDDLSDLDDSEMDQDRSDMRSAENPEE